MLGLKKKLFLLLGLLLLFLPLACPTGTAGLAEASFTSFIFTAATGNPAG